MASASSKADLPAWQEALLAVPEEQRCFSQKYLAESINPMEYAADTISSYGARNDLNSKHVDLNKAFLALVEVLQMQGNSTGWAYYLSLDKVQTIAHYIITAHFNIAQEVSASKSDAKPENLVPYCLTSIIFAWFRLGSSSWMMHTDQAGEIITNQSVRQQLRELLGIFNSASLRSKCNRYLQEELGSKHLAIENLITMVKEVRLSLHCITVHDNLKMDPNWQTRTDTMVEKLEKALEKFPFEENVPIYQKRHNLAALDFQFKAACWCQRKIHVGNNQYNAARSDRALVTWWKVVSKYMELLKNAVKSAKEAVPADPYAVAVTSRWLLHAYMNGIVKEVSYSEMEEVTHDIQDAVAACAVWAPEMFIEHEIPGDLKVATDRVLPFLRNLNPTSYTTTSISTFTTPRFL